MSRSQFGTISKESADKYRIFWQQGGRKRSETVHGSREDAEIALAQHKLDTKGAVDDVSMSNYWKIAVVSTFDTLSERTIYDYNRLWSVELEPRFGSIRFSQLNWRLVEGNLAEIASPTVQHDAYRLLKKVCNLALRDGLLKSNPVDRSIRLKELKKRPKLTYTREELLEVLRNGRKYKHFYCVLLEIGGGLRHEEACAVTQSDVSSFEQNGRLYAAINIDKALTSVGGKKVLKGTKNGFSVREAVIGEPFASELLSIMDRLPDSTDNQANPVTISRNWKRYCANNGIRYVPFAHMRTMFSTFHAEAGSIDSLVSLAMGHSGWTTRSRNYMAQTRAGMVLIADSYTDYVYDCVRTAPENV